MSGGVERVMADGGGPVNSPAPARAVWVAVTAPGMLLARALGALAVLAAVWADQPASDHGVWAAGAAAYFAIHAAGTLALLRWPAPAVIGWSLLLFDAALAGLLLYAGLAGWAAGIGAAGLAVGLAFQFAGWAGALLNGAVVAGLAGAVAWGGPAVGVPAPVPAFGTLLSVERTFLGAPVPARRPAPRATLLSVEPGRDGAILLDVERSFAGARVGVQDATPAAAIPVAVLLAALALIGGNLVSLGRVRRQRAAIAYAPVGQPVS